MKLLEEEMDLKCDNDGNLNNELKFEFQGYSEELESLIANVTWDNPVSEILFMGKYLVFLLDNLVPWQQPIGEYFKSSFVICAVKRKKLSEEENVESFCDTSVTSPIEHPLLVQFEKLICPTPERKRSVYILQQLSTLYNIYPLSIAVGEQLLFKCSKLENRYKLPFVTICHGNRPGSLVIFGAGRKNKDFCLKLLNQGNLSAEKNLPSIKNLKISHMEGLPLSLTSESSIDTCVTALYKFLGSKSDNLHLIPVKGAQLSVQCTWSMASSILELPPPESICFAKLKTVAGDDKSGAFVRYKEIKLLKALQQSLKTGLMTWISSNSLDMVLEEINVLANEEKKRNQEYPELKEESDKLEIVIMKERTFLSLPEKLWLIMKNCSSFGDLIAAIQHTYKVFADLNITFLATYANDASTISKDITSMLAKGIYYNNQNLDQKRFAELLLEIGVEKMRRDYYEYFIGHGFITQDLFNHYISPTLLSSEAVTCLEKLHSVLELTLVCIQQLNLPRNTLNEFVRNALKWLTTVPELDLQHVFTFHIPTYDIRPVLNLMRPVVWELSLKSGDQNYMKQSCHRLVTTPTHDHIYIPQNDNPKLMLKGASYVYSTGTLIEGTVQN